MEGLSWKIFWNEYAMNTYLHGSEVVFRGRDSVEFRNELMPPGTVVKRWYSKTNYQADRIEPTLPLIDGECSYRIKADITGTDPDTWLILLVFYDRYGAEAENLIVRNGEAEFRCPLKTYSYEIQLVSAGMKKFEFHSLLLTELTDGEQRHRADSEKSKKIR